VTLTDSADPVSTGDALRYTATATNDGPSTAAAVTLLMVIPPGASFVASDPTCTLSAGTLTCALGSMAAGASATVTADVTVTAPVGVLLARAAVTGTEGDPEPGNDVASATTVVRGAETELAHASVVVLDLSPGPGPVADEDRFLIDQKPGASYEVVLDAASGDVLAPGTGPMLERIGADGTTVLQGAAAVGVGPARRLRWRNPAASAVPDETIRVRSAGCTTDCGPDDVYRLRVYETTLSGARFNNVGSQATALIVFNPTLEAVTGEATFLSSSGDRIATHPFSLAPRATLVLDTRTVAAGLSGSLTIAHDGGYGALVGKTVALDPSGGFAFDSPLTPRPR
jgi:uncharacterized repeat protein (TIGR01451 family)